MRRRAFLFLSLACLGPTTSPGRERAAGPPSRTYLIQSERWASAPPSVQWVADDLRLIPEPAKNEVSDYYDFLQKSLGWPVERQLDIPRQFRALVGKPKEAANLNSLDEVPDSSWFTNRIFFFPMTPEEVARGPNTTSPDTSGFWRVIEGKTEGVTPGFLMRDARGDLYFIKFDPAEWPEMASSADVISSKFFWAAGYHTPEYQIVSFRRDQVILGSLAHTTDELGRHRPMTRQDLDVLFNKVQRGEDGLYRAVASKFLEGKPKGPFDYIGIRKDDPNDRVPHEHRRELRGLRVLAAWLGHNDARNVNTLDMFVRGGEDRGYLKHYLIDFGATLGSASVFPNLWYEGFEYILDGKEIARRFFSLGLYRPRHSRERGRMYPAVGYFESDLFDPKSWAPNYPHPAFSNMTERDAYWGAKLVMSFTDGDIRAVVREARISDPEAEAYLIETIQRRRDKVGRAWLARLSALDRFRVEEIPDGGLRLVWDDLAALAGLSEIAATHYRVSIGRPGEPQSKAVSVSSPSARLPAGAGPLRVTVRSCRETGAGKTRCREPVAVHLDPTPARTGYQVVAIHRKS